MPEKVNLDKSSSKKNIASLNSSPTSIEPKSAVQLNSTENKLATVQKMADNSPYSQRFAQLKSLANKNTTPKQPVSQLSKDSHSLPDNVKHGVESLSGISMDDVKVHYNSAKPAQLNAHAYAQGTDIHLASGQEKHLPHEAWHVVQQKQGRVRPTTMMKAKVPINDDAGLEKEADVMGARALQGKFVAPGIIQKVENNFSSKQPAQLGRWFSSKKTGETKSLLSDMDVPEAENEHIPPGVSEKLEEETTATVGPFTYEGGKVSMYLLDRKISLGKDSAALELPKTPIEMNLDGLTAVSVLIPLYPGVYATAGLTITPNLTITFDSGTAELTSNILSISNVGISGEMKLGIDATVGVEAGLAYIAGLEVGAFVGLGGAANLSGSLGGEVNFKEKTSTVKLGLDGLAEITGSAGAFGRAKLLGVAAIEKQFDIVSRTFARFVYSRNRELSNGWSHFMPEKNDFIEIYTKKGPYILGEEIINPLHREDQTGKPEVPTGKPEVPTADLLGI